MEHGQRYENLNALYATTILDKHLSTHANMVTYCVLRANKKYGIRMNAN